MIDTQSLMGKSKHKYLNISSNQICNLYIESKEQNMSSMVKYKLHKCIHLLYILLGMKLYKYLNRDKELMKWSHKMCKQQLHQSKSSNQNCKLYKYQNLNRTLLDKQLSNHYCIIQDKFPLSYMMHKLKLQYMSNTQSCMINTLYLYQHSSQYCKKLNNQFLTSIKIHLHHQYNKNYIEF